MSYKNLFSLKYTQIYNKNWVISVFYYIIIFMCNFKITLIYLFINIKNQKIFYLCLFLQTANTYTIG